jgi:hypothetical protein
MTGDTALFTSLPRNAEGHFRLCFYTAVCHLIAYLHRNEELFARSVKEVFGAFPFLSGYVAELRACLPSETDWQSSLDWLREQTQQWEASCQARLPLRELIRELGVNDEERTALILTGLVEEDIRFGSLFAALQEPLPVRRPCLGLVATLAGDPARSELTVNVWSAARRLIEAGLIVVENQQAPRAEWILRVPAPVWEIIRGQLPQQMGADCQLISRRKFPLIKNLMLDQTLQEKLHGLSSVIASGQLSAVILRGSANSGRRTVMGSLARSLRRDILFYDRRRRVGSGSYEDLWPMIGPLCLLTGALPVVALDPAPGETIELPPLTGYQGAVGAILRREGGVGGPAFEKALSLTLPMPSPDERLSVWRNALGKQAGQQLDHIAHRHLLPLGNVYRAARIAAAHASLNRRRAVNIEDTQMACRSLNRQALDTLAQRLDVGGKWIDLVVNESTAADLRNLERRCRHRERLLNHLGKGFTNSINRGVRALFNGPSGTGKTLAAKILAAELQMDIYRVDLASVVNKYIGETEKNLSQLLARAEELDVILLIDEGDSLMTNRTDVKSANDRYANLETNYLLQRLETYEGIVLVTTNAGGRIDTAFQRRFDAVVDFHTPDAQERLLIWKGHLPATHSIRLAHLEEIAHRCALTGGQIRNAALQSALIAVDRPLKSPGDKRDGLINDDDIEVAIQLEYHKLGTLFPAQRTTSPKGHQMALGRFLTEIK